MSRDRARMAKMERAASRKAGCAHGICWRSRARATWAGPTASQLACEPPRPWTRTIVGPAPPKSATWTGPSRSSVRDSMGASYTRRARPGEARSHELPDTMQLLVQVAEHAVRIEARLGRPVIRLVVDAPEPILGIVVARDQRLDAPELVRLLLELLGAVDARVTVRHAVDREIDEQVAGQPCLMLVGNPRVRFRNTVGHDPQREISELAQVPVVEL